jgi:hypothetical protein
MTESELLKIEERLKQVSILLAHQILFNQFSKRTQAERIIFLAGVGFDNNEIAKLVEATLATVTARLYEYRKKKDGKKSKKRNTQKAHKKNW